MLMQEDIDDRGNEDTALQAMEEPFYEILGHKYPVLPQQQPLCGCDHLQNLNANTDKSNGPERTERPESYRKWKVRNLKAGLVQLPLSLAITKGTQDMFFGDN
ncbi:hypothetical protein E2562_016999 [Oryza meyeriana var. granulata]|uniref:Uncharacterized protein n=1 Tax=Oryza meyeriana var. granulata TaxID=110450 RepID=A0A6G1EAF3_9ORYZ|nr:hypothetical protein E2562_016999 [Oryza meyeriana var. granulata]